MEEPKQPLISFEPVPLRNRNDGWTVEKQYAFIDALAEPASSTIRRSLSGGRRAR